MGGFVRLDPWPASCAPECLVAALQPRCAARRVYFSVQLITICAVVNLKCAPEKATCAVVIYEVGNIYLNC